MASTMPGETVFSAVSAVGTVLTTGGVKLQGTIIEVTGLHSLPPLTEEQRDMLALIFRSNRRKQP